ncbi:MAG: D-Ala-D-Ala carboxypeptidase family metallohydrolase, partial [Pseudomonadota bacterium]
QAVDKPDNPWHAITDFETDPDHGYALRSSPFDGMSDLQLAAVPKARRVHYNAPSKCVPGRLKSVLNSVAAKYGPVTVNSTYRSPAKNRKIGGKRRSWHLKCAAVDFRVHGSTRGLISYLRRHPKVGGYKRYKSGFYHIDSGPKRTW